MIKVVAEFFINPEQLETVAPLYTELLAETKKEAGCIEYDLFVDANLAGHYVFVETWASQEALDAHCASEHFTRILPQLQACQTQALKLTSLQAF